jgi:hypothetical protein
VATIARSSPSTNRVRIHRLDRVALARWSCRGLSLRGQHGARSMEKGAEGMRTENATENESETDALHWAFDHGCRVRAGALRHYAARLEHVTCATCLSRFDAPIRTEPKDPRPDDPAELARMVAIELRTRQQGTFAVAVAEHVLVARIRGRNGDYRSELGYHTMSASDFDNLGPIAIADAIQALEAKRAQEWAGDK